jgi:glyoxylase-like metal-dependent hydrolase (beta-lactamase superfamily II)
VSTIRRKILRHGFYWRGPWRRSRPDKIQTEQGSGSLAFMPSTLARPAHYEATGVRIDKLVVGPYENNVFILRDTESGDAVLLDAANEHELLLEVSRATGVRRVLTTHGHFDHIQAVTQMRDAGIDVGIATQDAEMLPGYDFTIPDDEVIQVGGLRLRTIHTPGHTRGSTCFLLEGHPVLFSGDTLFPGGVGNTSFEGGDFSTILRSVDERLFPLPAETLVLPGHGLDTTIGTERPHLEEWAERGW